MPDKEAHFSIDGLVLFQLGEGLITNVVQALSELVKNSYDADATYAKITINTSPTNNELPGHSFVMIEDNGCGMDEQVIREGWLRIASSVKRDLKKQGKLTARGRTPLGDKGLGRLGTQRLGANLEIRTRPEGQQVEYHVPISWEEFRDVKDLSKVAIPIRELPATRQKGTQIIVTDLYEAEQWTDRAVLDLQQELSKMISPYKEIRDFAVIATFNGARLNLADVPDRVRDVAQSRYRFEFDGTTLALSGRLRLDVFRPAATNEADTAFFRQYLEADGGQQFLKYLSSLKNSRSHGFTGSKQSGWMVEFGQQVMLSDLDHVELDGETIANPGPFHGEVDSFDLGGLTTEVRNVFDRLADFRIYVGSLAGIRVYRDGFGIQVPDDWLGLAKQWTHAGSWYTLRPNSTLGYVALSARDNAVLEETTDREGFKDNAYYGNFYGLLQRFVRFTAEVQEFIRRGWLSFVEQRQRKAAGVEENVGPEVLLSRVMDALSESEQYRRPLKDMVRKLESAEQSSRKTSQWITDTMPKDSATRAEVEPLLERLESVTAETRRTLQAVSLYMQRLDQMTKMTDLVQEQLRIIRVQLDQAYETVSLGLTAEVLSHEIHNIANQLAVRTRNLRTYLRSRNVSDATQLAYLDIVGSTISALRKELSHLTPSLRYVREKREPVDVRKFLLDIGEYHNRRMSAKNVKVKVLPTPEGSFTVYMNKGKLTQIVDNLVLNSQYWLGEDLRLSRIEEGDIDIEVEKPLVRVRDNGRGIAASVESTLFEPFVTTKAAGQGRGLGLFIVRQLLDSENCTIRLLPDRNNDGRLYIFEMNLTGGLMSSE